MYTKEELENLEEGDPEVDLNTKYFIQIYIKKLPLIINKLDE